MPHTLPVPPPPAGPPPRSVPPGPHAPLLLGALAHTVRQDAPGRTTLVGLSFVEGGVDLAATPTPEDPRGDTAGLFGFRAPPHWCGVAVVCTGRVRVLPGPDDDASDADRATSAGRVDDVAALVVVARDGSVASHLVAPEHGPLPDTSASAPAGLLVDTLHRALGLPTPGAAPPMTALVVGLWVDHLVELAVAGRAPSWPDAVACCPGAPGTGRVPASVETVAASAIAAAAARSWAGLRSEAGDGRFPAASLTPEEARWMDEPMFARWVLAALPDLGPALAVLRSVGAGAAADGVEAVARLVVPGI